VGSSKPRLNVFTAITGLSPSTDTVDEILVCRLLIRWFFPLDIYIMELFYAKKQPYRQWGEKKTLFFRCKNWGEFSLAVFAGR
jgi:hypothetical protein